MNDDDVDPLTGLPGRVVLLNDDLASPPRPLPVSVLVANLRDFREVNRQYGQDAGDRILRTVAHRLAEQRDDCRQAVDCTIVGGAGCHS